MNNNKEIKNIIQDKNTDNNSENKKADENIIVEKPVQSPLKTYPRLNIQIIEGPVVLEDSSLAYYRIHVKAAAYPRASISFSKDDSLGAWGPSTVQINLLPEETYNLKIYASNEIGNANAAVSLNWQEAKIIYGETIISDDKNNPSFYHIDVSVNEQKTRVYYKDKLLKELICSTGLPETPTPTGSYKTSDKIFYSWLPEYDVGAYYFVRFYNSYLFHSVPFDEQDNIIRKEFDNLGKASSHGCIRLGLEDAKWFYETLPSGIILDIK
ncbi:MAG: L,D-transpeptidase [Actinomycetota bacterium]|nr:L,D-transpeptidase [Actinomycetota bacterium]